MKPSTAHLRDPGKNLKVTIFFIVLKIRKMPTGLTDTRKNFILTTTGNYFGLQPSDPLISPLSDSKELNCFLDDGNEFVLSILKSGKNLVMSNKVE